jgi:hypothetical protein
MNRAHKSGRRSLWSALVRRRFGSPLRYSGNDGKEARSCLSSWESVESADDYQSGPKLPHSKGCRHFMWLAAFNSHE